MRPYLTVVMPAYNEAENLPRNVPRLVEKLESFQEYFEIVIVDDASTDATTAIAVSLALQDPRVRLCRHRVNKGIGQGFVTAVQTAKGQFLILIPADLALDLDELHKYLDLAPQSDIVVGRSSSRSDYSAFRALVSAVNIWLIRTLFGMEQQQFNYISLYRTQLLKEMDIEYTGSAFFFAEILVKARDQGACLREVDIGYAPREAGTQSGGNVLLIVRTVYDLFHFWLTRRLRRRRRGQPGALDKSVDAE